MSERREQYAEVRLTDAEREQRCRREQISHEHYTALPDLSEKTRRRSDAAAAAHARRREARP
jgi:hypothetical protein